MNGAEFSTDALLGARLQSLVRRQHQLVRELTEIRDAVLELRPPGRTAGEDREAYAGVMVEFSEWCAERHVSMPLTLMRLVQLIMRTRDPEPAGELTESIDVVVGVMRERLAAAGGRRV